MHDRVIKSYRSTACLVLGFVAMDSGPIPESKQEFFRHGQARGENAQEDSGAGETVTQMSRAWFRNTTTTIKRCVDDCPHLRHSTVINLDQVY